MHWIQTARLIARIPIGHRAKLRMSYVGFANFRAVVSFYLAEFLRRAHSTEHLLGRASGSAAIDFSYAGVGLCFKGNLLQKLLTEAQKPQQLVVATHKSASKF